MTLNVAFKLLEAAVQLLIFFAVLGSNAHHEDTFTVTEPELWTVVTETMLP